MSKDNLLSKMPDDAVWTAHYPSAEEKSAYLAAIFCISVATNLNVDRQEKAAGRILEAIRAAVEAEQFHCSEVAKEYVYSQMDSTAEQWQGVAAAIRARGESEPTDPPP
jgi:hypothetical protein